MAPSPRQVRVLLGRGEALSRLARQPDAVVLGRPLVRGQVPGGGVLGTETNVALEGPEEAETFLAYSADELLEGVRRT